MLTRSKAAKEQGLFHMMIDAYNHPDWHGHDLGKFVNLQEFLKTLDLPQMVWAKICSHNALRLTADSKER
jgi:hypothetical protein